MVSDRIARLTALGFKNDDCVKALRLCDQSLDDAALWLTQNAAHSHFEVRSPSPLNVKAIEVFDGLDISKLIHFYFPSVKVDL